MTTTTVQLVLVCVFWYQTVDTATLPSTVSVFPSDMVFPDRNPDSLVSSRSFTTQRWPATEEAGKPDVYIPFEDNLEPQVSQLVYYYMDQFRKSSCIRWVPRTNQTHFVDFTSQPPSGNPNSYCEASLGYNPGGAQYVYLSSTCLRLNGDQGDWFNVPHEMMHALGFIHEHQRRDRDCYVTITDAAPQNDLVFGVYSGLPTDTTFPYDPHSVMQYEDWTGYILSKFGEKLGPTGHELSQLDWLKLNYMYCGGPHVCDVDPDQCQRHQQIQADCGFTQNDDE